MFMTVRLRGLVAAAALSLPLAACGTGATNGTGGGSTNNSAATSGNISAAGSTALQPLVTAAAGDYQATHSGTKISVTGGGSRTGLGLVVSKAVDLGDSDILAQNRPNLIDHRVAVIGFAVITNPGVGVRNLSKQQVRDIFSGKVKNWTAVGGKQQPITVINRPASSGTRAVFVKTLMGDTPLDQNTLTEDATGTVVQKVKQTPGSVSYAAFSGTRNETGISAISIGGAAPNDANVRSGTYPFWSYEHIYTNGRPSKQISGFIDFLQSDKALLQKTGYIAVADMKVTESDR